MANDNRTKITFDYEGKTYTLCYTADALKKMEKNHGIVFSKLDERIMTMTEDLFFGAFIANHNEVPRGKRMEIYGLMCNNVEGGEDTLAEVLLDMVMEAMNEVAPRGNLAWKVERKA